jgi:hypothetical protein
MPEAELPPGRIRRSRTKNIRANPSSRPSPAPGVCKPSGGWWPNTPAMRCRIPRRARLAPCRSRRTERPTLHADAAGFPIHRPGRRRADMGRHPRQRQSPARLALLRRRDAHALRHASERQRRREYPVCHRQRSGGPHRRLDFGFGDRPPRPHQQHVDRHRRGRHPRGRHGRRPAQRRIRDIGNLEMCKKMETTNTRGALRRNDQYCMFGFSLSSNKT